jgi:DNA-binding NarL/FixJ family response regulator
LNECKKQKRFIEFIEKVEIKKSKLDLCVSLMWVILILPVSLNYLIEALWFGSIYLKLATLILIFSSYNEDVFAIRFINAGANGFLNKMSSETEIKHAITCVMNTGKYTSNLIKD